MMSSSAAPSGSIPLVDLGAQYRAHREELDAAVASCVARSSFIGGPDHRAFAEELAAAFGGGAAALCGNGTDALYLALVELLGHGDGSGEVITVSHTFAATAEAIVMAGYRPALVDVDPATSLMDVDRLEAAISERTVAIVPVHLYGQMVPMDRVMEIATRHELVVVEDAAQAHGASFLGKGPGQWGHAACFSFYPGKNLGAWGDGGAVLCQDPALAERLQKRANHGRAGKFEHDLVGVNSRLDGLQAAVLRVKLRHLQDWNRRRREVADAYGRLLGGHGSIRLPEVDDRAEHVFHLYVVRVERRDRVLEAMRRDGIGVGIHYPIPVHLQPAFRDLGLGRGDLPRTSELADQVLSLPVFPELEPAQVERVAQSLLAAVSDVA
jgi:dTDP-4-amino-4,6-dideoxygalactose transaminase